MTRARGYFGLIRSIEAGKEIQAELTQKISITRHIKERQVMQKILVKMGRDLKDTERFLLTFQRENPELVAQWEKDKRDII